MRSRKVELKLSRQLLQAIDGAARRNLTTRSSYIRQSVIMRLNDEHLVPDPKPGDILKLLRQAGRNSPG